jgi:hypothetical protein
MKRAPPDDLEDDGLARALGQLERERDAEQLKGRAPEWDAVARGELGVDEVAQRRRAAGDADVDRATEYFRPFAANETSALVDGLLGSLGAAEPQEEAAQPDNVVPFPRPTVAATPTVEATGAAKPHDPGSSAFWWIPGGMLAAAAAAILMFWVVPPSADVRELDNPVVAARDPLPGYVLETDGGLKQMRGDTEGETSPDDARHRYHRDTAFEWILRPKADFEHAVAVRAFAFVGGGSAGLPLQLDDLAKVAPTGAIRISGKIAQLNLEPGRYTIALAVGRPEELPTEAGSVLEPDAEAAFVVRRVDIVIEE